MQGSVREITKTSLRSRMFQDFPVYSSVELNLPPVEIRFWKNWQDLVKLKLSGKVLITRSD